jgi:DNA-binding winged helix-turn-helix (wHTH) protein
VVRYRFSDFIVSPRRRVVVRDGHELPLIPRYFDLLVFLIERRHEAVHRRDIFECVWKDVIVSDSALSQAIRTLRRMLGDDSREPCFIRTVPRHGYRFVFAEVTEEEDDGAWPAADTTAGDAPASSAVAPDVFEPLLEVLTKSPHTSNEAEEQREAAELLHARGTSEALERLGARRGHELARALLRDTRWDSPEAGQVPILGSPAPVAVAWALTVLRLRRAARLVAMRWAGASFGAGLAGVAAGALGGVVLAAVPGSAAPLAAAAVLAVIGGCCGALGGAGVGAGLSLAEAVARSRRGIALVAGAAIGGAIAGSTAQWIGRWSLAALFGLVLEVGGGIEGLVIGGTVGLGYALATAHAQDGLAAPQGRRRLYAATIIAALCGLGALGLTLAGRPLAGGTVHALAREVEGSQVTLAPLGRLIGEPGFGPLSRAIIGTGEGALFGFGLAFGLMRRPPA